MVVEKMRMEDIPQVQALHWSLAPFGRESEEAEKLYSRMEKDPDYLLLVAREGDRVLGTITGVCCHALSANFLAIEDFVVLEECRGQGIGSRLMAGLDEFAAERNCLYGILVSSGFRLDAHRFYESHGFTEQVRGFRKGYQEH